MRYGTVIPGRFLARPNRFIAQVETAEGIQTVHVKNTGRCRELLVPGAAVYLERGTNPGRKTAYDLIAVEKGDLLINMDAQAPNKVFAEWAGQGGFLPDVTAVRPEFRYGDSRLDFCLETARGPHLAVPPASRTLPRSGASSTSGSCKERRRPALTPPCSLWYNFRTLIPYPPMM